MSRTIVHKVALNDDEPSDEMEFAALRSEHMTPQTMVLHTREDEDFSLVRGLLTQIEELDEGEALVIYKVII